jgi:hypothetical protein
MLLDDFRSARNRPWRVVFPDGTATRTSARSGGGPLRFDYELDFPVLHTYTWAEVAERFADWGAVRDTVYSWVRALALTSAPSSAVDARLARISATCREPADSL